MSRRDNGQSTVEFAFALLLLAAIGVVGINSIVVVQHQIDVISIAREAALVAARSANPLAEAEGVAATHDAEIVAVVIGNRRVTVEVRRSISTVLRLIGMSEVRASVTMPLEPP